MKPQSITVQHIAITFEDGTIGIMRFVLNDEREVKRSATDGAIRREIAKTSFDKKVISWRKIHESEIPDDRTYRNAWRDRASKIEHDLDHARELHRGLLRHGRVPQLEKLDRDWMKATGQGDAAAAATIESERQKLRDLTNGVDELKTIEDLKRHLKDSGYA